MNDILLIIKKSSIFSGVITVFFIPFMFFEEVSFRIILTKIINIFILWLLVGGIVFFLLKERMPELFSLFLTEDEQEDFKINSKSSRTTMAHFFGKGKSKGGNLDIKVGDDNSGGAEHGSKTKTGQEILLERRTASSLVNNAPEDKKNEAVENMKKADSQLLAKAVGSMINKDK